MQEIFRVDVEEQDLQELEKVTPFPLTEKEQQWLAEAIDYFHTNPPTTKREGM